MGTPTGRRAAAILAVPITSITYMLSPMIPGSGPTLRTVTDGMSPLHALPVATFLAAAWWSRHRNAGRIDPAAAPGTAAA